MRSAVAFTSTIAESKAFTGQFNAVIEEHFGEDERLQPVSINHVVQAQDTFAVRGVDGEVKASSLTIIPKRVHDVLVLTIR